MHSDAKKRRTFVALLFAAGDLRRYAYKESRTMKFKQGKSFITVFLFSVIMVITSCVAVPATPISHIGRCGVSPV